MIKRAFIVILTGIMVASFGAACSTQRSQHSSAEKVDTLNITAGEAQPNFTRNFNAFSPASKKSRGATFFYEPLIRVDRTDANKPKPWLAKSFEYSNGGRTLTFKLRKGVTWSDGKPLTSADVKYSLELPSKVKGLGAAPLPHLKSVTTPDERTAVVHYSKPELHDLASYGGGTRLIVPAHRWKKHNPVKWTDKKPVGTGPYTLESFGTQAIKLRVQKHYWHGKFKGVKHVKINAFGSDGSGKKKVLKNEVSWSTMAWQNYKADFIKQDPKHNRYWVYPTGGSAGLLFNTKKSPTKNVHLRRALYAALDSDKLLKLYDTGQTVANSTGLDGKVWGDYLPSSLGQTQHRQDVSKAKKELKASGYRVRNGKLTKSGKTHRLTLKTNANYGNWSAYAPGIRSQWKKALGLKVSIKKSPSEQLGEDQQNGDFEILHDFLVGGDDIWSSLHTQLSGDYVKKLGAKADGNYGRYENRKIDKQLDRMANTRDPKKLRKSVTAIGKTVVDQVPYAPLHSSASYSNVNATDWTGWPDRDHPKAVPHTEQGPDATLTIENLKPNATKKK